MVRFMLDIINWKYHNMHMKLKDYRKLMKWTQADVADRVGVTKEFISMLERGVKRPSPEVAKKIEVLTNGAVPFEFQLLGNR